MIVTFETEYGKIECDSEKKVAYFYSHDFESTIDKDGNFKDMFDRTFHVGFTIFGVHTSYLEVWTPRTIAID